MERAASPVRIRKLLRRRPAQPGSAARWRYSFTVLREIPTLRATPRFDSAAATCSRSNSSILRIDNLSAAISSSAGSSTAEKLLPAKG